MVIKTRGIILRTIKYGEASAICNILTDQHGLVGFHIPSVYKNKGKIKISYLQPLNLVELSFNFNKTKNLHSISDITCHLYPDFKSFNQQAFYHVLCELLQQTIKDNEINHSLFDYLYNEAIPSINNELHFWQLPYVMLSVLHHYGCAPNIDTYNENGCLDLKNGIFVDHSPINRHTSDEKSSTVIFEMMTKGIVHLESNAKLRQQVTLDLVKYYQLHIQEDFGLRSMEVLLEVATK